MIVLVGAIAIGVVGALVGWIARDSRAERQEWRADELHDRAFAEVYLNPPAAEAETFTVRLSARSVGCLNRLAEAKEMTRTDVINHSIQALAVVDGTDRAGGAAYIREPGSRVAERLRVR